MGRQPVGFRNAGTAETAAVFARVPLDDARRLDRAALALGKPKREILSALLSTLDAGGESATGAHVFSPVGPKEVLTLDEAAALLEVESDALRAFAEEGRIPARLIGSDWRFSRAGVLAWLGAGSNV